MILLLCPYCRAGCRSAVDTAVRQRVWSAVGSVGRFNCCFLDFGVPFKGKLNHVSCVEFELKVISAVELFAVDFDQVVDNLTRNLTCSGDPTVTEIRGSLLLP